jgi:Serine aminopeptidase, S33
VRSDLQSLPDFQPSSGEKAGYFRVAGTHLYTVLHPASEPLARVLLVGPFASERQNSYLPWVRWARYLAARRIEVLRYDYRGVGESLGQFEETTFKDWSDDLRLLGEWYAKREPPLPLVFHGLEIGALLAGKCFDDGMGDAMLLWSPPVNANQALRSTLLRWVGLEQLLTPGAERRPASHYIRQLEEGKSVEVEGYQWSSTLWHDSFEWAIPSHIGKEPGTETCRRPVRVVELPKEAAPLIKGGFVGYDEVKDFGWLFEENSEWIQNKVALRGRGAHAAVR